MNEELTRLTQPGPAGGVNEKLARLTQPGPVGEAIGSATTTTTTAVASSRRFLRTLSNAKRPRLVPSALRASRLDKKKRAHGESIKSRRKVEDEATVAQEENLDFQVSDAIMV